MSGMETERKFLVNDSSYKTAAYAHHRIRQAYMPCPTATVRVRTRDDRAYLTIKGKSLDGISRYEFEHEITPDEAQHLFALCQGPAIDKTRWLVRSGDGRHTFEVDEFYGDNEGLVMAEVELSSPDEPYEKPPFIGREVTGIPYYYNKYMVSHPYKQWKNKQDKD